MFMLAIRPLDRDDDEQRVKNEGSPEKYTQKWNNDEHIQEMQIVYMLFVLVFRRLPIQKNNIQVIKT